jgi:uncharacterized membrane protein YkvA (DUF1232 family)
VTAPSAGARRGRSRRAAALDAELPEEEIQAPRTGARRTVGWYIKQLPHFLRLFAGLLGDSRVAALDKLLVGAAIAYIVMPIDWIPDFIPFMGEVDDVYLLVLALQRLVSNAGRDVLITHWKGPRAALADLDLQRALSAAAFFLPRRIRRRLRVIGRT